jgi:hypothetical protein
LKQQLISGAEQRNKKRGKDIVKEKDGGEKREKKENLTVIL